MPLSIRALFAVLLWLAAAMIVGIVLLGRSDPERLVAWAEWCRAALHTGTTVTLLAAAGALLLWPPTLPWLRWRLARLRERLSVDQRTLLEVQDRLRHFETAADHLTLGRLWLRHGMPARAEPHLRRAHELDPQHLPTKHELGRALLREGQAAAAVSLLRGVHAAEPMHGFGDNAVALGEALLRTGQVADAAHVLAELTRTYPGNRRALWFLSLALRRAGEHARAGEVLQAAAAPPDAGVRLTPQDRYYRARARVARWRSRA